MSTETTTEKTTRTPLPRVDLKRKLVCVFSTGLQMFEVCSITNKGHVSKVFNPEVAFTTDINAAFGRFSVPFAGFRAVPGVDKTTFGSWNSWIEGIWAKANPKPEGKRK